MVSRYKMGDRALRANQDLIRPGAETNALYILMEGWVFLYSLLEDGRRQIVHFAMPGALLGFPQVQGTIATFGAQALTNAVVSVIPHQTLSKLSREHPEVGFQLAQLVSRDLEMAFDQLTSVGRQSARERVARLLLDLFVRYWAIGSENGIETMRLPLTQEHVADATGLTSIHVNRILRGLKEDGIVEFHYRRLRVLNPDKLIDVAGANRDLAKSWFARRSLG